MALVQDLLDDLNQRLGDANNAAGVGEATKIRYLANALRAMWPRVFQQVTDDSTLAIVDGQYEYAIPATFDNAEIYRIDVQTGPSLERWTRVDSYLVDGTSSKTLEFTSLPGIVGAALRIRAVRPIDAPTSAAGTITIPQRFNELFVWYALGLAMQSGHYARLDYTRYPTVTARNGVDISEIMNSAQFCFAQFELLLDRLGYAWPAG